MTPSTSDIACCCFQRLAEFGQQSRVLDRNDRLGGERAYQFDLPLGERFHSIADHSKDTDRLVLAQQWHAKDGPESAGARPFTECELGIRMHILDMHDPPFKRCAPDQRAASRRNRRACHRLAVFPRVSGGGRHPIESVRMQQIDRTALGCADPNCGFDQVLQYRLEVECRAADDLQHLAGRGLVPERLFEIRSALAQFAQQPRILHRDDRLGSEILQKGDLFFRERAYPVAMGTDIAE